MEVIDGQKVAHQGCGFLWKRLQGLGHSRLEHKKSSSVSEAAEQKHIVLVIYIRFPCYESYSMDLLQYMNCSSQQSNQKV